MNRAARLGYSLVWVVAILLVALVVIAVLFLSYSNIYTTATEVCPPSGCEGVVSESSSSLMTIDIGPHDVSTVWEFPGVPSSFRLGTFTFSMIYNDTGYVSANGTQYPGFDVVFKIANETQSQTQTVVFEWNPLTPLGPVSHLPLPLTASTYHGIVMMDWTTTSPAYPNAKGPAAFLTVTVYEKPPYY
jgi:hypothetical protein